MNDKEISTDPMTDDEHPDKTDNIQDSEENVSNDSAVIEKQLSEAYSKNEDLQTKYLRTFADLENLKKRSIRDREESIKRARQQLIEDLLPVVDAFKIGMEEAIKADPDGPIVNGFNMAINQMEKVLEEYGLVCIEEIGGAFDPKFHEAIGYEEGEKDDLVLKIIRKGYRLKDHLIRPASVIVSQKADSNEDA
jgi:molecular chaperone GrpE